MNETSSSHEDTFKDKLLDDYIGHDDLQIFCVNVILSPTAECNTALHLLLYTHGLRNVQLGSLNSS